MLPCVPLTDLPIVSRSERDVSRPHIDIWWWPYPAGMNWSAIGASLPPHEQERAANFAFEKDAAGYVAGRLLQRSVLSLYTGKHPAELKFRSGHFGKPYLTGLGEQGIAFNLSNAAGLVVLAVSRGAEMVGIDAEPISSTIESGTASIFCSDEELSRLSALDGHERHVQLLSHWTLKESFLKGLGTGLSVAPDQLTIGLDPTTQTICISSSRTGKTAGWHHRLMTAPFGHLIAVSVKTGHSNPVFRQREFMFGNGSQ